MESGLCRDKLYVDVEELALGGRFRRLSEVEVGLSLVDDREAADTALLRICLHETSGKLAEGTEKRREMILENDEGQIDDRDGGYGR